jgi:hypothetical protein
MGIVLLSCLSCGCGSAQTRGADSPADPETTGGLDPAILATATKARGVEKVVVETGEGGAIDEIAVYHRDESKVPAAVKRAAEARFPGSRALSYETEREAGRAVSEVELETADGRRCEVQATDAGEVLYVECGVVRGDLPAAVVSAVDRLLPSNEFVEAEKREAPDGATWSVEARLDGVVHYVRLQESGQIVSHAVRVPATLQIPVD